MLIKIRENYFVTGDYFCQKIIKFHQFYQFDLVDQFDKVD